MIDFFNVTFSHDCGCGCGGNPCGNNHGCGNVKRIYVNTLTGITGPTGPTDCATNGKLKRTF